MKLLTYTAMAALISAMPTGLAAATWIPIITSTDQTDYSIDIDTIKLESSYSRKIVTFWVKTDESKNIRVKYRSSKMLYHANCADQTIGLKTIVQYDSSERVTFSNTSSYVQMEPAVPETVGFSLMEFACLFSTSQ